MAEQKELSFQHPHEFPKPDPNRMSPKLWVREIAVFRNLEEGTLIRRIKMRRGLNILWAEPEVESGPVRLYQPGLSGHASGKTTFCRLMRHVLGERHFANEVVTKRVREEFVGGWVLGEVVLNDELWLVGRPFTLGARPFCCRDVTIDQYLKERPATESFALYLERLEEVTIEPLSAKILPRSGQSAEWAHLLEWLARDQECRFIQLTDWRSKLSRSEAPDIPVEDQHALMRMIVGVLSEEERTEIENNARLNRDKESAIAEVPILQRQAKTDHQRLEAALHAELPTPDDPLLVTRVRADLSEELRQKNANIEELDNSSELISLEAARDEVLKKTTKIETELRLIEERLGDLTTTLQMHQRDESQRSANNFLAELPPGVGYCRVPMEVAKAQGCSLAFDQPRDVTSESILRAIEQKASDILQQIEDLKRRRDSLSEILSESLKEQRTASKNLLEARTKLVQTRHALYEDREQILDQIRLAERSHDTWSKASKLVEDLKVLEGEIQKSRDKQSEYRKASRRAVGQLSALYQEIVQAVLGESVTGEIRLTGREFDCSIERNGDVSSSAIDTIKILAFDLSALAASIAGIGNHPRFLIHDSPREADMAPLTYKRLFLWARELEKVFDGLDCNFQYIITTTEPPPEELQKEPWLLEPVLDASVPGKRLLGIDL